MKKYLYSALALPLLFACSSENFDEKVISNDQFAGIEKVDATFSMEGFTRFDGKDGTGEATWLPQEGDLWGFAWMAGVGGIAINGNAYQNHNLIQTDGIFKPQTSIYVGSYYIYRPYDKTTVTPQAINFNSLAEQTISEGFASTTQAWKDLAKTAINIGTKWTVVTAGGWDDTKGNTWDNAGTEGHYKLYAAMFSNQTGLDLTYTQNDPAFAADQKITGATDIDLTLKKGDKVGAAVIYGGTIDLDGAAKSFTYAPTASPEATDPNVDHDGAYWANKSNLGAVQGFDFTGGAAPITLKAPDENGISTEGKKNGWFWFNSLPVTAGNGTEATEVTPVFETSYGRVTVLKEYPATAYTVKDCAYALNVEGGTAVWHPLANAADATKTPTVWAIGANNTFINQYGNHKGKYSVNVDFSKGVMNGMHIKSDEHLQTALKYYIAAGKTENPVVLNLDKEADNNFKISKISIALLQTINKTTTKVTVKACGTAGHTPNKIIVTQDGSDGKEVPDLNKVFAAGTDVYLANTDWTWKERSGANQLTTDANVNKIVNMGRLKVNASNIKLTNGTLENAAGATMTLTQVTTVKTNLINKGTINVGAADNTAAELRAYNATVTNEATALETYGTINNFGVVGKSAGTTGVVNNYGYIKMMNDDAITLLSSNQDGGNFGSAWAGGNKMGTVELPEGNATALVSVSNATDQGFIKFKWTAATYATPAGNVKYNTIIVSNDITFTAVEEEIQYIEFQGNRTQVINPCEMPGYVGNKLTNLKGIVVHPDCSIIIEKNNGLKCLSGAYLAPANGGKKAATVYLGGAFDYINTTNYFGTWSLDQIVEW
jgi:hypothetical protein